MFKNPFIIGQDLRVLNVSRVPHERGAKTLGQIRNKHQTRYAERPPRSQSSKETASHDISKPASSAGDDEARAWAGRRDKASERAPDRY